MSNVDTATVTLEASPAPGPGARTGRTVGQAGAVLVFVDLWRAFDWLGADTWTADQATERWPAVTAAAYCVAAGAHNFINWWRGHERRVIADTVTVQAQEAAAPAPPRRRSSR